MERVGSTFLECCVIIEMEQGVTLDYTKAALLNEIEALKSIVRAAKMLKISVEEARSLLFEMNGSFSRPLVFFYGNPSVSDNVILSAYGSAILKRYWLQFDLLWSDIIEERRRFLVKN